MGSIFCMIGLFLSALVGGGVVGGFVVLCVDLRGKVNELEFGNQILLLPLS